MKTKKTIFLILLTALFFSCKTEQKKVEKINPIEELAEVDALLSQMADKPQHYTAPSDTVSTVTGAKGTIIHVDPDRLETVDGSPLGDNINIELVEMTERSNFLLNNTQTVSNGEIIETGGAYYLNMTSDGKQLKMKSGKGLEVEFPKISEKGMEFFQGERDSLGQVNWVATKQDFVPKDIPDVKKPSNIIKFGIGKDYDSVELNGEEYKKYLKSNKGYLKKMEEIEYQKKTYEAIEVRNFGLINCDRFIELGPRTDIQLLVKNNSLTGARIFAYFKDLNSIMSASYFQGQKTTPSFNNIPIGKELQIIALSAKGKTPYVFEKTIKVETDRPVQIDFSATTQEELKRRIDKLN